MKYSFLLVFLFQIQAACSQVSSYEVLAEAAFELTAQKVIYDGSYQVLDYPGGDVAADRGVCTDVVIRAYRSLGIDLQVLVHEDMTRAFSVYPQMWRLKRPDRNIDHRRVPNLMCFFERHGQKLPITSKASDYRAGDIVCWNLGGAITHIGIVSMHRTEDGLRPMVVHNIGGGQVEEDCLFAYPIIGHYRYNPDN